MAKFCGVCGSPLDPVSGKCPNCDKDEIQAKEEIKEETEKVVEETNVGADLFCDVCGSKLDPNTGLCPNCSNKQEEQADLFCDMCGSKIDPKTGKCPKCSKKETKVKDLSKETIVTEDKPVKSKKPIVAIIAVLLVVAALGAGVYFFLNNRNSDSTKEITYDTVASNIVSLNDYLKENSSVSEEITASTSESLKSEKELAEDNESRGLTKHDVAYNYSQDGEELVISSASKDSSDLHPQYFTYYETSNGNTWGVYYVNGETYASNIVDKASNQVILTETDHITIYDHENDKFVKLTPNEDVSNVYHADKIDSSTLESIDVDNVAIDSSSASNNEDNTTTVEKHVVDMEVWDVQPYYDFDDIDVDFAITYQTASNYATSKYFDFNHDELYDFVIPGGFIFVKDGKYGFGNGDGEIVSEATYTKSILKDSSSMIIINEENTGDGACEVLKSNYYHEKGESYGRGGTGTPSYAYNTETGSVVEIYDSNWSDDAPAYFDLYSYGVKKGMNEGGIAVLSSTSSKGSQYLDGYVVVSSSGTKVLDVSTDYSVYAVTSNIIMFTKGSGSSYKSNPINRDSSVYDVMYVDEDGNVIASGYETGYPFYEGYAAVKKDGKWGYIDTSGNVVVDFVFDKATPLYDGKAWVIYNGKAGKMNIKNMIDNNAIFNDEQIKTDEWLSDGNKYLQVTVDVLKKRETPSTSGYDDGDRVGNGSIGVYYEKTEADGYTWYKIKDYRWIADKNGEWITELN